MSCGEPHETDCSEVLDHLYEYLDREMPDSDCEKYKEHFDECSPCFEKYGLEREVKKLVKRCCGQDDVPTDLRAKVMSRIEVIRQGQGAPQEASDAASETAPAEGSGPSPAAGKNPA
ncbi:MULTISPECIES: mycothiol system anti-sigma-R factor [unclassified Streptomyces]|uniref:mycothiol system anti-sigma-R factor n=1 Tax=unclassified Streptomyces TaxID=2593676 RepID=UPI002DD9EC97|nr:MULTISPECIES: mycothiol system anti-sigma-R factor [unclassified Streptomyces]WSA92465.1 mycothiol system anti-sigma-R factor [Streptomyces sp. NBC_01795]WSB76831.1 mycothiol system anti-sigma-R factor [Streptomyces sp. NBC_01775]WSS14895.1 mycothiol system anti-sigma-R factor [Streptomyces sp. NBC_01186]WSS43738.1 mycothiol system anti-sigma-R factor [Streptomyces sp. NBC_01187]